MDADHSDDAKVPKEEGEGDVVHGQVVRLENLAQVEIREEEQEEERGDKQPPWINR